MFDAIWLGKSFPNPINLSLQGLSTTTANDMTAPLSIAIIGGGMGGLAAACAMGRAGLKVDVFEQAPKFEEVGAGLKWVGESNAVRWDMLLTSGLLHSLGPNTVRTLGLLGLGEAYASVAEVDQAGGLFFEWWDGIKDVKHGEVGSEWVRRRNYQLTIGWLTDVHEIPTIRCSSSEIARGAPRLVAGECHRSFGHPYSRRIQRGRNQESSSALYRQGSPETVSSESRGRGYGCQRKSNARSLDAGRRNV